MCSFVSFISLFVNFNINVRCHLDAEYCIESNKTTKRSEKMTEETAPKPVAEKADESTPKQTVESPEKSTVEKVAEEPKTTTKKPLMKTPEVVFIGNKPPMSYVMAVMTALSSGAITEITLKARGRAIATAVDVAEIACNRFIKDLRVVAIGIGTEEMPAREGENKARNVSTLEIKLAKK
jgi:DNA-binding protein